MVAGAAAVQSGMVAFGERAFVPVVSRRTIWIALLILPIAVAFACAVAWSLSVPLAVDPPDDPPPVAGSVSSG
jgi:hypothetical protein